MALLINTEQFGIQIPSSYVRIEQVRHNIFDGPMECVARYYASNPGPIEGGIPAFRETIFSAVYSPTGGEIYAQAYAGAKALPEFSGAIDI